MLGPGPRVVALFESGASDRCPNGSRAPAPQFGAARATDNRCEVELNDATWGDRATSIAIPRTSPPTKMIALPESYRQVVGYDVKNRGRRKRSIQIVDHEPPDGGLPKLDRCGTRG